MYATAKCSVTKAAFIEVLSQTNITPKYRPNLPFSLVAEYVRSSDVQCFFDKRLCQESGSLFFMHLSCGTLEYQYHTDVCARYDAKYLKPRSISTSTVSPSTRQSCIGTSYLQRHILVHFIHTPAPLFFVGRIAPTSRLVGSVSESN
jgi:hypothetical protein